MTENEWVVQVEADCIMAGIPGDTKEDAREYVEQYVKTGHLGPVNIKSIEEDE